jgi:hypothetical protein
MSTVTYPSSSGLKEKTLEEVEPLYGKRIAIVGPPGSGKTWLAATWPAPAFLDVDHNIATLKQEGWRTYAGGPKKIILAQPYDIRDKRGIVLDPTGFWQSLEKLNEWSENTDIKTIVIDSLTSLSVMAMSLAIHANEKEKRSQTKKEALQKHGVLLYTEADFGSEMGVMEQLLEQMPQIPQTVIFNCHVRTEYNSTGSLLGYKPLITGNKHRESFGRWFNEVWWLETRGHGIKTKRVLMSHSDNLHQFLKTTMSLPVEIEDPSYDTIRQKAGL